MDDRPTAADRMNEIGKQWRIEADALAKYGDEKTADWVRNHATTLGHLAAMVRREMAQLASAVPDSGTLTGSAG